VAWNGGVYVVPASMAFGVGELSHQQQQQVQQQQQPPSDFDGMAWCQHMSSLPTPRKRSLQTIGIPEPIRQHFQSLDLAALRQMDPEDERYKEIPPRFHSACPLDDASSHRGAGGSFGYPSSLYKVVDRADSQLYTLRRFDNVRTITPSVLTNAQATWAAVRHPSIASLYSISMEKGAVFFAHAYHPSAQTLQQRFLNPKTAACSAPVGEALLWRLLSQLLAGIRHVHSRNMAIRSISTSHILLTSGARFRIANVGVVDVLEFESRKTLADMQAEDLCGLGCVLLSVAARTAIGPKSIEPGMAMLQQHYSQDLCQAMGGLLSGQRSAEQMCHLVYDKICDELDFALASSDALHLNLQHEYENGRLLRLLLKLGCINERPEHALAPSWSETGDRYVLKLFRDYLFHQSTLDGAPQVDMGHVVSSLNKLDTADPEQILLSSRNGKDILVASFYDINRCAVYHLSSIYDVFTCLCCVLPCLVSLTECLLSLVFQCVVDVWRWRLWI
jgi:PAB-dependent poly(A)-specific ribonuclease subunit 3